MNEKNVQELVNGESIRIRFTDRMKKQLFLKKQKPERVYQKS